MRRRANSEPEEPLTLTRGLSRVGNILRDAHAKDFERRKKPELGRSQSGKSSFRYPASGQEESDDDDDDDDYDNDTERERRSGGSSRDDNEMAGAGEGSRAGEVGVRKQGSGYFYGKHAER